MGVNVQGVSFTDAPITAGFLHGKPTFGRVSRDGVVFRTSKIETRCGRLKKQGCTHSFNYVIHPVDTVEKNISIGINNIVA
jgi:hypothetical protein